MKLEFSRQIFEWSSNIKFHENQSRGNRVPCGRTDRRTDRHDEANSRFFAILRTLLIKMSSLSTEKKIVLTLEIKAMKQNANNISSLSAKYARKFARETEWSFAFCHSGQDKSLRFLCKFIKSEKKATSPSVRPHRTTWLSLDGFSWNLIESIFFPKSVDKVSLKSGKNNGYFIWRPMHVYNNISLSSFYNTKCLRTKL